jgi:hypothetical protein
MLMRRLFHYLRRGLHYAAWPFLFGLRFLLVLVGVLFIPFIVVYFATATRKDVAYRNLHPYAVEMCKDGLASGWDILSHIDGEQAAVGGDDQDGWIDPSNNELYAIREDPEFRRKFRCSLQRHVVPVVGTPIPAVEKQLEYYLGFVEFRESGEPYSLVRESRDGDEQVPPDLLRSLRQPKLPYPITQLDVLRQHLASGSGSNYVIVFVHGWRHDASIGDQNVADLRHYAAHAARFLAVRCQFEKDHNLEQMHCDTRVTAIYVGWRGARVNERAMRGFPLYGLGSFIAEVASWPTLFDRKPVSEQIAPAALSALRAIERQISTTDSDANPRPNSPHNKMIVFGHSLGGNLLATSLQDDLIKAVRLHKPGDAVPPVLGNLVVLINPASEAEKWTGLQREVWSRIAFRADANTHKDQILQGHVYFPPEQKPVVVSVTSSFGFPPGGLRDGDCMHIALTSLKLAKNIATHEGEFEQVGVYDWATHDLFPTFKMDFRPAAERVGRLADWIEGKPPLGTSCLPFDVAWYKRVLALPLRGVSNLLSTFPFQNTDRERSHTIGHLDPPRPGTGSLTDALTSAAPFGTTHELFRVAGSEPVEQHNAYGALPNAAMACDPANHWLRLARAQKPNGTFWDSNELGNRLDANVGERAPAAQFVHGFPLGGTAAITRANDPFWNMRVSNGLMSKHDGYRLSSFICAMNELVMDDVTGPKPPAAEKSPDGGGAAAGPAPDETAK